MTKGSQCHELQLTQKKTRYKITAMSWEFILSYMIRTFLGSRFVRLNLTISLLFPLLLSIFLVILDVEALEITLRAFQATLYILLVTFSNSLLFSFLHKKKESPTFGKKLIFFFTSYGLSITYFIISVLLYKTMSGNEWEGNESKNSASVLAVLAISIFNTIILLVQQLLFSQIRIAQSQIEKLQLKANLSENSNLLLKQQIHPHFLFNALNTIKLLYKQNHEEAERYLMLLASFLRTSLSNHQKSIATLEEELAFCISYLDMQKIRFGEALAYEVNLCKEDQDTKFLPHFSLQPLIENAIKHNGFTTENPLRIRIFEENNFLVVKNNKQKALSFELSTGQGLYNLRERYILLGYDNMTIINDNTTFEIKIPILKK